METPNYYAIITADVRYNKDLKANEKLLYGEITCLTQSTGECFASNEYFAKLYNVSKETVSRWVSNLKKCGYVDVVIKYKEDGKTIDKRIITLLTKRSTPYCEKDQYPIDKKIKDNNTRDNNTSIIKKINKKESTNEDMVREYHESNNSLNLDAALEWIQFKGNSYKAVGIKKVCSFLCKYDFTTQSEIVDSSIMNNYKGLFEPKKTYNKPATNKKQSSDDFIDNFFGEPEIVEVQVM